ncbi:hypothetical protein BT96DRAFT_543103 [Gymnopus androsaceus JB14]|uniref:Uncharacterized protein n=1 Tax=Gymnopus androsaceus JB14 TaxID=1447944 RepID=A0A6A4HWL2_9AGAR|nr:hypothetical protein BT96DRAFT_543103 [Gymnopus androsaceus JB14]
MICHGISMPPYDCIILHGLMVLILPSGGSRVFRHLHWKRSRVPFPVRPCSVHIALSVMVFFFLSLVKFICHPSFNIFWYILL